MDKIEYGNKRLYYQYIKRVNYKEWTDKNNGLRPRTTNQASLKLKLLMLMAKCTVLRNILTKRVK